MSPEEDLDNAADTGLSTVARYAGALWVTVTWSIEQAYRGMRPARAGSRRASAT